MGTLDDIEGQFADWCRISANSMLAAARDLEDAAKWAPEETSVAPFINIATFLRTEADKLNPEKPLYPLGENVIPFRRRGT